MAGIINVDLVRKWVDSWVRGDTESAAEMFHQDCEVLLPRNLLEGGSYRGPEGVRRVFDAPRPDRWIVAPIASAAEDAGPF